MRIARRVSGIFLSVLAAWLLTTAAPAQERDEYGNSAEAAAVDSQQGPDDIRQTVARLSVIDGEVSYARGDAPDDWQGADRNVPVTLGDRLYTGARGRAELEVHGGSIVRIGSNTDLAVLNMTDDTKQFAVKSGVASIYLPRLDGDDVYEIDTPNTAITLEKPGDYRVDIDADGNTRVTVRQGQANVAAGGGSLPLASGDALRVWGTDDPQYASVAVDAADGWDRWVTERQSGIERAVSRQYVSPEISGASDLDQYGRWETIPTYGRVWAPTVAVGWEPYRVGRWIWQDPWGWTWVSTEPWGWAPYHYGRWVFSTSRWWWVPVAGPVRTVTYSPALVAFVGGGPGWSASFSTGGAGYVGWFPLAPRDPFIRWWGPRVQVNVTNITYVNRTYVTVVNRNTFVSAGIVSTSIVRDRYVVRQVSSAPVLRGPIPVAPTRQSIFIAARPGASVIRPPAAVVSRSVVARVAPPPAPPTFDRKLAVITENRGAPVAPAVAAQVAVRDRSRPQAITAVRPVANVSGSVTLRERTTSTATGGATPRPMRVEPVAPVRGGRPMATAQQPVAAAPVVAPRPARPVGENVPARVVAPPTPPPAGGGGRPARVEPNQPQVQPHVTNAPNRNRVESRPTFAPRPTVAPHQPPRAEREREREIVPTPRPAQVPDRSRERERVSVPPTAPPERSRERASGPPPRPTPAPQMERREPPRSERAPAKPTPRKEESRERGPRLSPTPKQGG
ncbi:MAG TPA: DUF6600 domain-containing protein [Thermoanaerobaculia bacterium]